MSGFSLGLVLLVMEAVVGDAIAPKLREHYSSGGNELKLEVGVRVRV